MKERYGWLVLPTSLITLLLVSALPGSTQAPSRQERELTARVEELYRLFVAGDWKKVEPMVSEGTQNIWLVQPKGKIEAFQITEVKVEPDGRQANVTVMVTYRIPQVTTPFTQTERSKWVLEKGRWVIQLQPMPSLSGMYPSMFEQTPNSNVASPTAPLPIVFSEKPVRIRRPQGGSETTVKVEIQNVTPNTVKLQNLGTDCPCLKVVADRTELRPVEKGNLTLTYNPSLHPDPKAPLHVRGTILAPAIFTLDLPVNITDE